MSIPVADDEDEKPKPHPENEPEDGVKTKKKRDPLRTAKHDWLDDRFGDEIDLELAMSHAPPMRLVRAAETSGAVNAEARECGWLFLGKFKTSVDRPSTSDSRWAFACRRCKGARKVKTMRFLLSAFPSRKVTWLNKADAFVDAVSEHVYRVGRCAACGTIFWLEMMVKK